MNVWQDTRRKLDVLLNASKPPLYSLAILLAAEEQLDPVEIMSLYKVRNDVSDLLFFWLTCVTVIQY